MVSGEGVGISGPSKPISSGNPLYYRDTQGGPFPQFNWPGPVIYIPSPAIPYLQVGAGLV